MENNTDSIIKVGMKVFNKDYPDILFEVKRVIPPSKMAYCKYVNNNTGVLKMVCFSFSDLIIAEQH